MRRNIFWVFILILGFLLIMQGCGTSPGGGNLTPTPSPTPMPSPANIVPVNANITTDTNWTNNNLYVIDEGHTIYISATLTIQRGTIIKFSTGSGLSTSNSGAINATGDSGAPIYFTSLKDDTIGGDTNGDGGDSSPNRGDWGRVKIDTTNNTFNYCKFYFGGNSTYDYYAMLHVNTGSASITHCTFAHSQRTGVNISSDVGNSIANNSFFDNATPLWLDSNISLNDSNVFHNPVNASQGNDYNGIWMEGSISADTSWGETEVAFVISNVITVGATKTLTLQPGVTLKFKPDMRMDVSGTLSALGNSSKHITFTSFADDSKGGNSDSISALPQKSDWGSVQVGSVGSNFGYCDFYYGGIVRAILWFGLNSSATVDHCVIAHSSQSALDLINAGDSTVVTNNAFFDTTQPLWMSPDFSISGSNIFHNPANSSEINAKNGIWLQTSQTIRANRNWGVTEVPYVAGFEGFSIDENIILTMTPGAVVKFIETYGGINISTGASINNFSSAIFTSIKDDSYMGDTNGDGASVSTQGDWEGIWDINYDPNSHWRQDANILHDSHSGNL